MIIKKPNTVIVNNHILRKNIFELGTGLMFRKPLDDQGMIFIFSEEQPVSLHMFFVFFSIDVIFLDNDRKIVEMKDNFRPFAFYRAHRKARYFIEFRAGTIVSKSLKTGDIIDWQ